MCIHILCTCQSLMVWFSGAVHFVFGNSVSPESGAHLLGQATCPWSPSTVGSHRSYTEAAKALLQSLQREVPASVMKIVSFCSFGCPPCPLSWEPFETYRYELLPLLVEDGSRVKLVNISYKCHHSENWCRTPNSQLSTKHVPNHIPMLCKPSCQSG